MSEKSKIVVSDLHLGAGFAEQGNGLEDFHCDREFAMFLADLAAESDREGAAVELIVNGDAFEMFQVPHVTTFDSCLRYSADQFASSSEVDSARKMGLIIAGHRPFFEALGRFLQAGPPRRTVTFIKGNHDVHLHWIAVQRLLRQAVGAVGTRAPLLAFEERCIRREGLYIEHGNQYAERVDRMQDMEEPHDHDRPGQLALPVGARIVTGFVNSVEWERYWIDGVKPITAAVWYALAYDWPFAVRALGALLRALPHVAGHGWSAEAAPAQVLAAHLADSERGAAVADRYIVDEAFRTEFHTQVADLLSPQPELPGAVAPALSFLPSAEAMGDQVRERVHTSLYLVARRRAAEEDAPVVVFGHTHVSCAEPLPEGGCYFNSGTWTWYGDFSGADGATWQDLFAHPERYARQRRLTYVRIDYDGQDRPSGRLLIYEPSLPPEPRDQGVLPRFTAYWARAFRQLSLRVVEFWEGCRGKLRARN